MFGIRVSVSSLCPISLRSEWRDSMWNEKTTTHISNSKRQFSRSHVSMFPFFFTFHCLLYRPAAGVFGTLLTITDYLLQCFDARGRAHWPSRWSETGKITTKGRRWEGRRSLLSSLLSWSCFHDCCCRILGNFNEHDSGERLLRSCLTYYALFSTVRKLTQCMIFLTPRVKLLPIHPEFLWLSTVDLTVLTRL